MVWHSWGHSGSTPAPGELSLSDPDPATQYETARVADWFAHYLQGSAVGTGPNFAYFRDWVSYSGIATPAFATSGTYPVGSARTLYLAGSGLLAQDARDVTAGSQSFMTPAAGAPTSLNPLDVLGSYSTGLPQATDAPGTYASWTTGALAQNL